MTRQDIQELARRIAGKLADRDNVPPSEGTLSGPTADEPYSDWVPAAGGIAGSIDHTLLRPDASERDVIRVCDEARTNGFHSACIHPDKVALAERQLRGSGVKVCTVIGFPHGAHVTPVKCAEAEQSLKSGARELDMVINIGALKQGRLDSVHSEIRSIVELAHSADAIVKVILEMGYLDHETKVRGCVVARLAGADFVKTATGFGPAGADPEDVALMRQVVGHEMGIKAAGGIRTYARFRDMMRAGATRIGASASLTILEEFRTSSNAAR